MNFLCSFLKVFLFIHSNYVFMHELFTTAIMNNCSQKLFLFIHHLLRPWTVSRGRCHLPNHAFIPYCSTRQKCALPVLSSPQSSLLAVTSHSQQHWLILCSVLFPLLLDIPSKCRSWQGWREYAMTKQPDWSLCRD